MGKRCSRGPALQTREQVREQRVLEQTQVKQRGWMMCWTKYGVRERRAVKTTLRFGVQVSHTGGRGSGTVAGFWHLPEDQLHGKQPTASQTPVFSNPEPQVQGCPA